MDSDTSSTAMLDTVDNITLANSLCNSGITKVNGEFNGDSEDAMLAQDNDDMSEPDIVVKKMPSSADIINVENVPNSEVPNLESATNGMNHSDETMEVEDIQDNINSFNQEPSNEVNRLDMSCESIDNSSDVDRTDDYRELDDEGSRCKSIDSGGIEDCADVDPLQIKNPSDVEALGINEKEHTSDDQDPSKGEDEGGAVDTVEHDNLCVKEEESNSNEGVTHTEEDEITIKEEDTLIKETDISMRADKTEACQSDKSSQREEENYIEHQNEKSSTEQEEGVNKEEEKGNLVDIDDSCERSKSRQDNDKPDNDDDDNPEQSLDSVDNSKPDSDSGENNLEVTPEKSKKKKSQPITVVTPRRSSRNLNKQKSYTEKDDVDLTEGLASPKRTKSPSDDPDIEEIILTDPLAVTVPDSVKRKSSLSKTIVVNDTKRLVEIAAGSKPSKGGKKEPTLVIIDTNSILSGRGPVPISSSIHTTLSTITGPSRNQGYVVPVPVHMPTQNIFTVRTQQQVKPIVIAPPPPQPQPQPQPPPPPPPKPPVILPSLTDDMFVVEAPSFIVPYVYEKPPIKPLKEYVDKIEQAIKLIREQLDKEDKEREEKIEQEKVAKETAEREKDELEREEQENEKEKEQDNKEKCEEEKEDIENEKVLKDEGGEKGVGEKENTENKEIEEAVHKDVNVEPKEIEENCCNKDEEGKTGDIVIKNEKDMKESNQQVIEKPDNEINSVLKNDLENDTKNIQDAAANESGKNLSEINIEKENDKEKSSINEGCSNENERNDPSKEKAIILKPNENNSAPEIVEEKKKPSGGTYFDNPLGKFFMQIGVNLVQEHVQTDLLRSQKRKRDRDGHKCPPDVHMAINSLIRTLEFSKENNEPFKMEQKKCEYCNFKTESSLVLAHHLETPHMRNYVYRCNFCPLEVRSPHDILFHMEAEHNVRGRLERAPAFHQCPNCPFEDNQKGKLTRHLLSCAKKYRPERNQEPPLDWEPPAKIPRVARNRGVGGGLSPGSAVYQAAISGLKHGSPGMGGSPASQPGTPSPHHPLLPKLVPSPNAAAVMAAAGQGMMRGRGRPQLGARHYMPDMRVNTAAAMHHKAMTAIRPSMMYRPSGSNAQPQVLLPTSYQIAGNQIYQSAVNNAKQQHQQQQSGGAAAKLLQQPSISITPLPRQQASSLTPTASSPNPASIPSQMHGKPGRPPGNAKATFVICEICDGYIKDLEQLRNHMQWIHKVKIHPKMIYNRPPLNCQKCQFRFFTDQGLERHLLGSHGLVTSSMQEAANKGKDGGRCPVCGRVYQWKLLNHVARDHNLSLKPAHLSYKCTVCTATFGMYKQFETHVYSAHSVVAKRVMDKKPSQPSTSSTPNESLLKPLKINDEITIIPQPARASNKMRPGSTTAVCNKGKV